MKKQTSVDWLAEQLDKAIKEFLKTLKPTDTIIDKAHSLGAKYQDSVNAARQMHREEVEGAVDDWMVNRNRKGKDYYTQTFETP